MLRISTATGRTASWTVPMFREARQSRVMSLVESITNVAVGFLLAIATQFAVFPFLGIMVSAADNVLIGTVFTAVSLVRSYLLRRLFEALPARGVARE